MKPLSRVVAIAVLALSSGVGAQSQAPPSPQAPAAPPAAQVPANRPTFRVAIDYVTTDVIARNQQDQFVADLTKDDFELFEDGVKQDITSLTLVHGGRVHNLAAPPVVAELWLQVIVASPEASEEVAIRA